MRIASAGMCSNESGIESSKIRIGSSHVGHPFKGAACATFYARIRGTASAIEVRLKADTTRRRLA